MITTWLGLGFGFGLGLGVGLADPNPNPNPNQMITTDCFASARPALSPSPPHEETEAPPNRAAAAADLGLYEEGPAPPAGLGL